MLIWTFTQTHTYKNGFKSKQAPCKVMNEIHIQATVETDKMISPSVNSCLKQNNKPPNDVVSCPLWLRTGKGTTSKRRQLQMARLYNQPLLFSQLCIHRDPGRSQRQINLNCWSCWSGLKCQSITAYQERAWLRQTDDLRLSRMDGHTHRGAVQ